jgi:lipoate-protein ligase A
VLVGPGILQYSCFFRFAETPGAQTIRGAMAAALHPLQTALRTWSIFAQPAGLSDLAVLAPDGALRKLAGNAQARKRRSGVVHGALLADPDWALLEQVLRFPTRAPDYRAGRGHRDFLISLRDLRAPCDLGSLVEALSAALGAKAGRNVAPREEELARARELLEEKYSRPEWNLRR